MERNEFEYEFSRHIQRLSHQRLKTLSKMITIERKRRFNEGNHYPKTEIERGFTDEEFNRFMACVDDKQDYAAFMFMATLGLRVGELAMLKGEDLRGSELMISGLKGGFSSVVRLPPSLLSLLDLKRPDQSLFDRSPKTLRLRFSHYRKMAGLNNVYLKTKPCGRRMAENRRYRLSLHSLRHYAIQRVYLGTKDPDLTRRFARHRKFQTTITYMKKSREEEVNTAIYAMAQPETIKEVIARY